MCHFHSALCSLVLICLLLGGCGEAPPESSQDAPESPSQVADENVSEVVDNNPEEEVTSITNCDAVAGDCPSPIVLRSGDVLTVFFDYVVNGQEAKEFSATGTAPQVALSPVMVGAEGAGDRASIEVTGHALGEADVDIVIWYGENKDIERTYNLLVSIIES